MDQTEGFAIEPKRDCPHVKKGYDQEHFDPVFVSGFGPCEDCHDLKENWLCLQCFKIHCSRYQKGHATQHYEKENTHPIAVSFRDLSVWCYECDSYIMDEKIEPLLNHLLTSREEENDDDFGHKNGSDDEGNIPTVEMLSALLRQFGAGLINQPDETLNADPILKDLTPDGVASGILEGKFKKIIVMTGAGISVAAGIPDFRTPGTGLYDNLQKYGLPHPTAVFEIEYFRKRPEPFYTLAKELYPGNYDATAVHYFIRLLAEKGLLLRNFTQNIDTLERVAGVDPSLLVEAHGSFGSASCIDCHNKVDDAWLKEQVFSDQIPHCRFCNGLIKPDIVFFGESLPERFHQRVPLDFSECDLLIVIGTSLQVQPFASLIDRVKPQTPRLLINREEVGKQSAGLERFGIISEKGFRFGMANNYRDVALLGDCQDGVYYLAKQLGWKDELDRTMKQGQTHKARREREENDTK
ncbi:hypothetical protein PROFUN_04371 [Planoprotostelium fungivorum]|uniref:Protein acetyllysine N-acetyltransferase n=1 Tax=Planoprotostelium fungivorum TaxID=1890364 RepID=A0A2P6NHT0_9EUKA|nr:hypothetical protein PROFUN_04371 [Planoprotostelium fungivorum]